MRIVPLLTAAALALSGGAIALSAPTAAAACPEMGKHYTISNVKKSRLLTNLRSDYLKGPGTINYTTSKTGTVTFGGTVTVGAEAGVIFAKASASASVSLSKAWSKSGSWSYTKPVPKGKTARLVMYHESRSFTAKMYTLDHNCKIVQQSTMRLNAPRSSNINVWDLQYA